MLPDRTDTASGLVASHFSRNQPSGHPSFPPAPEGQRHSPEGGGHGHLLLIRDLKVAAGDATQHVQLPPVLPEGNSRGIGPEQLLRHFDGAVEGDVLVLVDDHVSHRGAEPELSHGAAWGLLPGAPLGPVAEQAPLGTPGMCPQVQPRTSFSLSILCKEHRAFVTTTGKFRRPRSKTTPLLPRIIKGGSFPFPKMPSQDSGRAAPPKKPFLKQTGAAQAKENTQPRFFGQGRGRSYSCCITPQGLEYKRIPGQQEFGTLLQQTPCGASSEAFSAGAEEELPAGILLILGSARSLSLPRTGRAGHALSQLLLSASAPSTAFPGERAADG